MKPPIHRTKKRRKFSPFLFSPFFVNKSTLEVKISLWKDVIYKNVKSRCTKETKKKKIRVAIFFFSLSHSLRLPPACCSLHARAEKLCCALTPYLQKRVSRPHARCVCFRTKHDESNQPGEKQISVVKSSRHRRADRGPTCPIASLPRHRPRCDLPNCVSPEAPTETSFVRNGAPKTETRHRRTPKTLLLASSARYFLLAHATTATIDRSKKKKKKKTKDADSGNEKNDKPTMGVSLVFRQTKRATTGAALSSVVRDVARRGGGGSGARRLSVSIRVSVRR